ncbi:uncharacterized protein LOC136030929 [Artemia franciscana]|uniref:uncharacterized protein LOC136030929 n=1 Tax=Artemia franciscana TaxID=6661 RepID=UPI0032DB261B
MSFTSTLTAILDNLKLENSQVITIQCKNGNITVQKILLTATSDVFSKMFDHDMLEKRTNIVVADDVDVNAMKAIIGCYEDGRIPDMSVITLETFSYVIDKYNFLGIKEMMAEHLLDKFAKENDLTVLELIFTTYDCKAQKKIAINEIAMIIVKGGKGPDFIVEFDNHDFLQLSEIVYSSLKERKFKRWDSFLDSFYGWVSKNSEERSGIAVEILGMIDVRQFSASEVLKMLEPLSLSKRFHGFKLMFEKTLDCIIEHSKPKPGIVNYCEGGVPKCSVCGCSSTPPYHFSTGCNGIHRCRYYDTTDYTHCGDCNKRFSHDAYIDTLYDLYDVLYDAYIRHYGFFLPSHSSYRLNFMCKDVMRNYLG